MGGEDYKTMKSRKSKKEIISAALAIIECYCQDGDISIGAFYSLPGSDRRQKDSDIEEKWQKLCDVVGYKNRKN